MQLYWLNGTKYPLLSLLQSVRWTWIYRMVHSTSQWFKMHQSSLLSHDSIPIEQRPPIEACLVRGILFPDDGQAKQVQVMFTPPGLDGIYNPSFDVTPAELVTAIVTEKGVAVKAEGDSTFDLTSIVWKIAYFGQEARIDRITSIYRSITSLVHFCQEYLEDGSCASHSIAHFRNIHICS